MPYQNISAELTPQEKADLNAAFDLIFSKLPFAVNLTKEEHNKFSQFKDDKMPFVIKALDYSDQNPTLRPQFLSLPEARKDFNLNTDLAHFTGRTNQLTEILFDTRMAARWEAFQYCLKFYASVGEAKDMNVAGAEAIYDDLRQYFELPAKKEEPVVTP